MSIVFRAATEADAPTLAAIYGPHVVQSGVSFEDKAPDAMEMARRIGASPLYPWIVAEREGVVIGFASASRFRERAAYRWAVETSVYISGDMQGQGFGRMLYRALIATLTEQGFTQAIASITLPNEKSIDLHEAVGFQRGGVFRAVGWKQGQWRDVGVWQHDLAYDDNARPPEEPRSFAEVGVIHG